MNNFNFSKNPFNQQGTTKIAGDHVFKKSDGGRMSLDEVRDNMTSMNNTKSTSTIQEQKKEPIKSSNSQLQDIQSHLQALKNINRL